MRGYIAKRPRAGLCLFEPPYSRKSRVDDPVLQICAAIMMDLSYSPIGDYLFCEGHCRSAAVVMADHVNYSGALHPLEHLFRLCQGVGERLLAKDDLLCLGCRERDRQVGITWSTDIDDVNVLSIDDFLPGRRIFLPPKLGRGLFYSVLRATADDFHHGFHRRVKEFIDLSPGIAMSPAHELVPDHGYVQFVFHGGESRIFWPVCQARYSPNIAQAKVGFRLALNWIGVVI